MPGGTSARSVEIVWPGDATSWTLSSSMVRLCTRRPLFWMARVDGGATWRGQLAWREREVLGHDRERGRCLAGAGTWDRAGEAPGTVLGAALVRRSEPRWARRWPADSLRRSGRRLRSAAPKEAASSQAGPRRSPRPAGSRSRPCRPNPHDRPDRASAPTSLVQLSRTLVAARSVPSGPTHRRSRISDATGGATSGARRR